MNYTIQMDLTATTVIEADDVEQAEYLAQEYAMDNYPELSLNGVMVSKING